MFGLLVVLAGLIGAAVLYVASQRRPEQAVDEFARAPVGCTTTLEFTDTGTFYVYEERSDIAAAPLGDCQPVADPSAAFGFSLSDANGDVDRIADLEVTYEFGARSGQSISSFEVTEAGRFDIEVVGDDLTVVAAIGRDPDESVADLRRAAIAVGLLGLIIGGVLLFLSGRRSRHATAPADPPTGAVWHRSNDLDLLDTADTPVARVPMSAEPGSVDPGSSVPTSDAVPPPPPTSTDAPSDPGGPTLPARPAPGVESSPWAPPSVGGTGEAGTDEGSPPPGS